MANSINNQFNYSTINNPNFYGWANEQFETINEQVKTILTELAEIKKGKSVNNPLLEKMVNKLPSERVQIILDNYREALSVYSTPENTAVAIAAIAYAFDKVLRGSFYRFFAYPDYADLTPQEIDILCESIMKNEFKSIIDLLNRKGVSQKLLQAAFEQRDRIIDENKSGYKCNCGLLYATPTGFIVKQCVGCARKVNQSFIVQVIQP